MKEIHYWYNDVWFDCSLEVNGIIFFLFKIVKGSVKAVNHKNYSPIEKLNPHRQTPKLKCNKVSWKPTVGVQKEMMRNLSTTKEHFLYTWHACGGVDYFIDSFFTIFDEQPFFWTKFECISSIRKIYLSIQLDVCSTFISFEPILSL